jgi:hypothetical protein
MTIEANNPRIKVIEPNRVVFAHDAAVWEPA